MTAPTVNEQQQLDFAGLTFAPVSSIESDKGICILLYGPAGAGKTTLAATIASSKYAGQTAHFDAEGGVKVIKHRKDVLFTDVYDWQQIKDLEKVIRQDPKSCPFGSMIFDNISEYADVSMRYVLKKASHTGAPQIQHYGQNTEEILDFVRFCRDAARRTGINFVIIAWDDIDKEEGSQVSRRALNLTPKLVGKLPGIVDIIGYLSIDNDPPNYTRNLTFAPSPKNQAKFRRALEDNAQDIPLSIAWSNPELPLLGDIVNTLRGGDKWVEDKYTVKRQSSST